MAERKYKGLPRKTTLEDRNRTMVGLVALAVLAAMMAAMVIVTKIGPGYKRISADFTQAAALLPKNPVTVAGIPVGTVTGMKLNGDRVTVDMKVQNDIDFGKDSRATIMVTTILGSRYVSLTPGGGGPLNNNTIDINHTSVPYDLQEALQDVAVNYGDVNTDQLATALEALGKQIQGMPPMIPKAMDNLKKLSNVMSERRDQFGSMLRTMDIVTATLRRQQSSIGGVINQGNELMGEFVMRQAAFHNMLAGLRDLVTLLNDTIITDRAQVDSLLANMNTLAGLAKQHDDLLQNILQSAPVALRQLANATGSGNAIDATFPNGLLVDSWMCAISGRAQQFELIKYYKDCK